VSAPPFSLPFPELRTPRLVLRETVAADAPALLEIFSDPAVTRFYNLQRFENIDAAHALIARRHARFVAGHSIRWGIAIAQGDVLIGSCGLIFEENANGDPASAELGYEIASTHWNRGYAGEALRAVIAHAFGALRLRELVAHVMPGNDASAHLLRKLGFESHGVVKDAGFWQERHHDLERFTLKMNTQV
jgi:[ribosomal protein S5]-alanine N-acetyltransferase